MFVIHVTAIFEHASVVGHALAAVRLAGLKGALSFSLCRLDGGLPGLI